MGSWEGYVSNPLYLFNNGTWSNLQTPGMANTTPSGGDLRVPTGGGYLYQTVDLTNYNYLKLSAKNDSRGQGYHFSLSVTKTPDGSIAAAVGVGSKNVNNYITGILDVSHLSGFYYIKASSFYTLVNGAKVFNGDYFINQIFLTTT